MDIRNDDIERTYRFLAHEKYGITEVRVIDPGPQKVIGIGYFDNKEDFVKTCQEYNGRWNVYVGIQPRPRSLMGLARNKVLGAARGARDLEIEWITSIVIDLDPERPRDLPSTDQELELATRKAKEMSEWFVENGFIRPVVNLSGNGCQLWFAVPPLRLTEGNRDEVKEKLLAFEGRIRKRFQDEKVKIDSINNLSRIIRVVGTKNVKGPETDKRPHRISHSLSEFKRQEDKNLIEKILKIRVDKDCQLGPYDTGESKIKLILPFKMCSPVERLWTRGYPRDRSKAIFALLKYFRYQGLGFGDTLLLTLYFDRRTGYKLINRRDQVQYIENCYQKIQDTHPPCKWLREIGYCMAPCERFQGGAGVVTTRVDGYLIE